MKKIKEIKKIIRVKNNANILSTKNFCNQKQALIRRQFYQLLKKISSKPKIKIFN